MIEHIRRQQNRCISNESEAFTKIKNGWTRGDSNARPSPCKGSFFRYLRLNRVFGCDAGRLRTRAPHYASSHKPSRRPGETSKLTRQPDNWVCVRRLRALNADRVCVDWLHTSQNALQAHNLSVSRPGCNTPRCSNAYQLRRSPTPELFSIFHEEKDYNY
jgi:hypothetical protein